MKKIWVLLSVALLLSVSFLSFAATTKTNTNQMTVVLDWIPNPNHGPLIVAQELGYFREANLDVRLIGPSDPTNPPKWVAAKQALIGISYEPQFMKWIDRGLPLVSIGSLIDKPLSCIVALKDSGIKTVADLKQKRIGSSDHSTDSILLTELLKEAHLTKKDVELIQLKYNLNQGLLSKRVDAVTGMMRNVEVPELEHMGHHLTVFYPEEHHVPSYSELIYIVHRDHKNDKRLKPFLLATQKAVHFIANNPDQAWKLITKTYPALNTPANHHIWQRTIPYFDETPMAQDEESWQKFADFMHKNALLERPLVIKQYMAQLA